MVQALGGALVMPASLALVLTEFPPHRRSAAIGIWGAVGGIAAATGPSLGGVLIDGFGWRSVFFINPPLCLAAWLVGRRAAGARAATPMPPACPTCSAP